jgi:peptide/nickel transport system substrate-binding protein
MKPISLAAAAAALALFAVPASAQKANDTIKLTIQEGFPALDLYLAPSNEAGQWVRDVYGRLTVYDEHKGKMIGELAKSWKRIDDKTIEFDLRDDIYFTSGNKFTADDVKYTLEFVKDPALNIRFKARYTWYEDLEVLSPTKIRLRAIQPRADDLELLTYRFLIFDKAVHEKLEDKATYGRTTASSTGAYKLVSIDRAGNIRITRNDDAIKKFPHLRAPIKNVVGVPIPDRQTQIAQLLTGGVHVLSKASPDTLTALAQNPNFVQTPFPTRMLVYMTMDAAGRSDNKILTDVRIRQAIFKAINREGIIKNFIPGADIALRPDGICFHDNIGCASSTKPIAYDPAGAKKLMAEAGYPDGFDIELGAYAPYKEITEAIAGDLRKVGIRASVNSVPLSVYTKLRGDGKLTTLVAEYPTFSQPNMINIMDLFFGGDRDYTHDPIIKKIYSEGSKILDDKKRTELYRQAVDRVNEQAYIYPLSEMPNIFVHSKDVVIKPGMTSITETRPGDYFWK